MLESFCAGVQARVKRAGFDFVTLIPALLPVVVQLIQSCFNKASDLQSFVEGRRSPLQVARLRSACRQVVQEQGIRGVFRVAAATSALQEAVIDEMDAQSQSAASGIACDDAFEEAFRYPA